MKLFQYKYSLCVAVLVCALIEPWPHKGWLTVLNVLSSVVLRKVTLSPTHDSFHSGWCSCSHSVASCCGAWLQALPTGQSFSTTGLYVLSSWSTRPSWTALCRTWKTRLQRLQTPSLKRVSKRPFTGHVKQGEFHWGALTIALSIHHLEETKINCKKTM